MVAYYLDRQIVDVGLTIEVLRGRCITGMYNLQRQLTLLRLRASYDVRGVASLFDGLGSVLRYMCKPCPTCSQRTGEDEVL